MQLFEVTGYGYLLTLNAFANYIVAGVTVFTLSTLKGYHQ